MKGRLTQKFVDTVSRAGRYADKSGTGLLLVVKPTGARSWIQRTMVHGRQVDIGLGSCRRVRLAEARQVAFANWCTARDGGDPRKVEAVPDVVTFADGLDATIALLRPTWRNPKSEGQWRASLRDHAGPLMDRPLADIATADILTVLSPIWHTKGETARRVRQRVGRVLDWSVAQGLRPDNPAGPALTAALPRSEAKSEHFRTTGYQGAGAAVRAVRATGAWIHAKLAFEFLTLTAARSGEVRGMQWCEVDLDAATWTIPASRMKAGREHRVPLSDRALAVLREAAQYRDGSGLVFPSKTGRTMSDSTLSKLCRENGIEGTVHGMRSAFRDWCGERTNVAREVAEMALAHTIKDKAEAAYARSDLLERRRELMESWSLYVTESGAKVVRIVAA